MSTAELAHLDATATGPERLPRFAGVERALHWATAAVVLTVAITGMILYTGPLSGIIGRRETIKTIHVIAGLSMPVPLLLAYAGRWRTSVQGDVRRLARWTRGDKLWLRTLGRTGNHQVGKFNAGQKANAAFVVGMIPVMMVTGSIMRWFSPFPLSWRTGATFVHDWTAIATWLIVGGHILVATSKPPALWSMFTGRMSRSWALVHHPLWAEGEDGPIGEPVAAGAAGVTDDPSVEPVA
jgi:formate dehydrogenase subunit gamma